MDNIRITGGNKAANNLNNIILQGKTTSSSDNSINIAQILMGNSSFSNDTRNISEAQAQELDEFAQIHQKEEEAYSTDSKEKEGYSVDSEDSGLSEFAQAIVDEILKNETPEEREEREQRAAIYDTLLDIWYPKRQEVAKSTKINDENLEEMKEYFAVENDPSFLVLYEKYDAYSVVTESGQEVLRFCDEQGRPVVDYTYGDEGSEDNKTERGKTKYFYMEDGSYRAHFSREFGTELFGNFTFGKYMNYYLPQYFDSNDKRINDPGKIDEIESKYRKANTKVSGNVTYFPEN